MHVVVIGNGIAGTTAALRLRRLQPDWRITVVSGESDSFFSRPALMYLYMGHMRLVDTRPYPESHWESQRIERVRAWVTEVDTTRRTLRLDGHPDLAWDKLLIATGSQPNRFGWPGQDLERVQGLYSLQDLQALERATPNLRRAVIVGGGLIGIELAEMLHCRDVAVTILARETQYWNNALPDAEAILIGRRLHAHGIELRLETELAEIVDDGRGRACAVVTGDGDRIDCQLVGLTAGVRPNLAALQGSDLPTGRGVLCDASLATSVDGVYAAGDCAEIVTSDGERNVIEQLWYTGRMQGEVVAEVMAGRQRTYDRGTWFNSAKFLDLEWQTYGRVAPAISPDPAADSVWWEHPSGLHALRIVSKDGVVTGMNALGMRARHRVWERWLSEGRTVDDVLDHLGEAHFDPELFRRHEGAAVAALRGQLR